MSHTDARYRSKEIALGNKEKYLFTEIGTFWHLVYKKILWLSIIFTVECVGGHIHLQKYFES